VQDALALVAGDAPNSARPPRRFASICEAIDELYARFGFEDVHVELSTGEKSMGTEEQWERAEAALAEALRSQGREYELNPATAPSTAEDRLPHHRRARSLLAVRHLPARLPDARALRPLLHRRRRLRPPAGDDPPRPARLDGALRRDLIEHYGGRFPVWAGADPGDRAADLRPPQPLRLKVMKELREAGVRVAVDDRSESIGKKIRDSSIGRYPYMLVVGDREEETGTIAVRSHEDGRTSAR